MRAGFLIFAEKDIHKKQRWGCFFSWDCKNLGLTEHLAVGWVPAALSLGKQECNSSVPMSMFGI